MNRLYCALPALVFMGCAALGTAEGQEAAKQGAAAVGGAVSAFLGVPPAVGATIATGVATAFLGLLGAREKKS